MTDQDPLTQGTPPLTQDTPLLTQGTHTLTQSTPTDDKLQSLIVLLQALHRGGLIVMYGVFSISLFC